MVRSLDEGRLNPDDRPEVAAAWLKIEAVLAAALDLPPDARASFLDTACADDAALRADVAALVAASEEPGPVDAPVATLTALLADLEGTDENPPIEPGRRLGPYVVVAPLGAGGMGQVYRARDTRLERDVAVKIVAPHLQRDEASRKRLEREARVIASLSHPNILAVYDIGDHEGMVYVVTELLTGRTFRQMLEAGPLEEQTLIDLATQVARGLSVAHARHIVHRDLKPENLFVTQEGVVKILDFGLAKPHPADSHRKTISVTAPHAMVGTIGYMSPEQVTGDRVDARSDLFSLGAVLYEAATGAPAFDGPTRSEIAAAILSSSPPWPEPARISSALGRTIVRCLARAPAERYQTAADLAFTLQLLAVDSTGRPGPTTSPYAPVARRAQLVRPALAAALVIAAAILVVPLIRTLRPDAQEFPVTFTVRAPRGATFQGITMAPFPAVSPDGRRLTFVAASGSQLSLWVQTLGELEARHLVRLGNTPFPFWSPDGTLIGFGSEQRLQRVAASADRAPQDVCVCDARYGGSWSANGTIIFAGASGLSRVSSGGGEATPLTRIDESRGELAHRFPVLLPDGTRFLYLIRSSRDEHRGVYLGSLDDPTIKRRIVADDSNVAYAPGPNGRAYLFFVRDRVLLAQPFDVARGTLDSDPIVVAQPVVSGEAGRFAPFAVGGRSLVYRRRSWSRAPLFWVSRAGVREGTIGAADANYESPSLSADGTKLAVGIGDSKTGKQDIWVIDLVRQMSERLTRDPVGAVFPQWMSDGRRVVFASARSGFWDIYWQSFTESGAAPLFDAQAPGGKHPTGVSRDGRFLLAEDGSKTLWLVPLTGDRRPQLLFAGWHGRVSPDGRWLAYVADDTGVPQVYVTTFPTPTARWRVSTAGGQDPQWRRDGRELYYVGGDETLKAVPVVPGARFEPGTPESLFRISPDADLSRLGSIYAPAPDGQRFIVNEIVGANESAPDADDIQLTVTLNWTLGAR